MEKRRAIYRDCVECGQEFTISPKFQEYVEENGLKLPKRCRKCRDSRKEPYKTEVCVDCGNEFVITVNEHKFYIERGFVDPKRCPMCRSKKHDKYKSEENKQE